MSNAKRGRPRNTAPGKFFAPKLVGSQLVMDFNNDKEVRVTQSFDIQYVDGTLRLVPAAIVPASPPTEVEA